MHNDKYDERLYWRARTEPNDKAVAYRENVLQTTLDVIYSLARDKKKILEFGPGVGRTLAAYTPAQEIHGYDISDAYVSRVTKEADDLGLDFHLTIHDVPAGWKLPYSDDEFELAVAIYVLQHQRPEKIDAVLKELLRVAPVLLVGSSLRNNTEEGKVAPHCFEHDYENISGKLGLCYRLLRHQESMRFFSMTRKPVEP